MLKMNFLNITIICCCSSILPYLTWQWDRAPCPCRAPLLLSLPSSSRRSNPAPAVGESSLTDYWLLASPGCCELPWWCPLLANPSLSADWSLRPWNSSSSSFNFCSVPFRSVLFIPFRSVPFRSVPFCTVLFCIVPVGLNVAAGVCSPFFPKYRIS